MTDVTITTPTHQLPGYFARPTSEGSWPGVIVLHDAAGMTHDLRQQADWLAGAGYLAVAPDLLSWGRKMACLMAVGRDLQGAWTGLRRPRVGARGAARRTPPAAGRSGSSASAWAAASPWCSRAGPGWDAVAANYGMALPQRTLPPRSHGACPVVASYGGRGRYLRGAAATLEHRADRAGCRARRQGVPGRGARLPQRPPRGGPLERPIRGARTSPGDRRVRRRLPRTLNPGCPPTHSVVL